MINFKKILSTLACLILVFNPLLAANTGDEEPLAQDVAFKASVRVKDANTLIAEWTLAEGYYLYKDKFSFGSNTAGIEIGTAKIPAGKVKKDPLFGDVEVFRARVSIDIPIKRTNANLTVFSLDVLSQGCADMGLCYPPYQKTYEINLSALTVKETGSKIIFGPPKKKSATPTTDTFALDVSFQGCADKGLCYPPENYTLTYKDAGLVVTRAGLASPLQALPTPKSIIAESKSVVNTSTAVNVDPIKALNTLGTSLGLPEKSDFLPVDQAFRFVADIKNNKLTGIWKIADGYYLYRDKIKITPKDALPAHVKLGTLDLPPGKNKKDPLFGEVQVYYQQIEAHLTLDGLKPNATETSAATKTNDVAVGEHGKLEQLLKEGHVWLIVLAFYIAGLGLAFTPCVFPMIPILMAIITGQGKNLSTGKAFKLSLVYVLAMALVYTTVGVVASMLGKSLNAFLNTPSVVLIFVAVFVMLALSMFGLFSFQMPTSVQSKLTEVSNKQKSGSVLGVATMGVLAALIAGPCVAAPIAGALIYIADHGNPFLGGIALFSLSIGMGTPLLAIGTGGGKLLPKAGAWMDNVKSVFGVAMLGLAIWLLDDRIESIPDQFIVLLWGIMLVICAIYMGALTSITKESSGWHKLWKSIGVLGLIYGIMLLIGAASGGKSIIDPIGHLGRVTSPSYSAHTSDATHTKHVKFKRIKSLVDLNSELAAATREGKTVMLDFYADWCVECKRMEQTTFLDTQVHTALANTVLLQADVTKDDGDDQKLRNAFKIPGPPAMLFFDKKGNELRKYRVFGYLKPVEFVQHLTKVNTATNE